MKLWVFLYLPYLEAIGAVMEISDAVGGSMCWCPITNLDYADAAYEWNLGITRTDLDEDMQALSDRMAQTFAEYINQLELKGGSGQVLTLADTTFPYTPVQQGMGGRMGGPGV